MQRLPTIESLHYVGPDLALTSRKGKKLPGVDTETTKQLRALKRQISKEGIFCYADMFAFAAASLKARPFLREALRHRFPWVFVDEMQDTSSDQEALLDDIFSATGVALNKIGDRNQSIFSEAAGETEQRELAWTSAIDLPQSQRLAPKLAELVTPLAIVHPLKIQGSPRRKDRAHTIFLFDEATIAGVLPAFGDLILTEWEGALPPSFVAKAVGFRRRPHEKPSIPGSIPDYWAEFEARAGPDRAPHGSLLAAVRHARRLVEGSDEFFDAHRTVTDALARLVGLHEGARVTRRDLTERCRDQRLDERLLKGVIASLLRGSSVSTSKEWVQAVKKACECVLSGARGSDVEEYLAWDEERAGSGATTSRGHVFVHRSGEKRVSIEVATIHAVKGETHDATLVLETLFYEHDVQLAIPILIGGKAVSMTKPRLANHIKRLFVASTRPKELVCFAVHRSHATDDQLGALRDRGWTIAPVEKGASR